MTPPYHWGHNPCCTVVIVPTLFSLSLWQCSTLLYYVKGLEQHWVDVFWDLFPCFPYQLAVWHTEHTNKALQISLVVTRILWETLFSCLRSLECAYKAPGMNGHTSLRLIPKVQQLWFNTISPLFLTPRFCTRVLLVFVWISSGESLHLHK